MIGGWKIFKRGNLYYLRIWLKQPFRQYLDKTELWRSLHTGDQREAKQRACILYSELCAQLAKKFGGQGQNNSGPQLLGVSKFSFPAEKNTFVPNPENELTVKELISKFEDEYGQSWGKQTAVCYRSSHRLICEYFGSNTMIQSLTISNFRRFRDEIRFLPANWKKSPKDNAKKIRTLLRETKTESVSAEPNKTIVASLTTVNKHIAQLKRILLWAFEQEYLAVSVAQYLKKYPRAKFRRSRRPFEIDELNKWFNDKYLITGLYAEEHFWMCLIMLYTGMRLGETAQLVSGDFKHIGNIPVVGLSETQVGSMERHLKTDSSHRQIPIHSELLRFGIWPFVEKASQVSDTRLFPSCQQDQYGSYSNNVGKRLGLRLRKLNIPKEVVVHSFRHGFRDAMREAQIPDGAAKAIGGWKSGQDVSDQYGSGYSLGILHEYINKIQYPGLRISEDRAFLMNGG